MKNTRFSVFASFLALGVCLVGCGEKTSSTDQNEPDPSGSSESSSGGQSESPESKPLPTPIFVSREGAVYPAIQVDLLDAIETWPFTTAELYLSLQSSRFPDQTLVLLPINVGDFSGVASRFVILPFEAIPGDEWTINLLDDDHLSDEEEKTVLACSRLAGMCVWHGIHVYPVRVDESNDADGFTQQTELVGRAIAQSSEKFDNYGTAKFVVPKSLPHNARDANVLTILDGTKARANIRVFFQQPLPQCSESTQYQTRRTEVAKADS